MWRGRQWLWRWDLASWRLLGWAGATQTKKQSSRAMGWAVKGEGAAFFSGVILWAAFIEESRWGQCRLIHRQWRPVRHSWASFGLLQEAIVGTEETVQNVSVADLVKPMQPITSEWPSVRPKLSVKPPESLVRIPAIWTSEPDSSVPRPDIRTLPFSCVSEYSLSDGIPQIHSQRTGMLHSISGH